MAYFKMTKGEMSRTISLQLDVSVPDCTFGLDSLKLNQSAEHYQQL